MADTMTLVERTIFLKSVDLLAGIPTEPLAQLAAKASEVHAEPGQVLFREGDEDKGAFLVVDGEVELRREGAAVRVLGPRSTHGELFLGEAGVHQYTGIARAESHTLNLDRADVLDALADFPEFGLAMVKAQALLIHRLTERVLQLEGKVERGEPIELEGARAIPDLEVPPDAVAKGPAATMEEPKAPAKAAAAAAARGELRRP